MNGQTITTSGARDGDKRPVGLKVECKKCGAGNTVPRDGAKGDCRECGCALKA